MIRGKPFHLMTIPMLISLFSREESSDSTSRTIVVIWDTQTGTVVNALDDIQGEAFVRIEYSGDGGTITAIQRNRAFNTYNGRDYSRLCGGTLRPPRKHLVGILWAQGRSVRLSTSLNDGKQLKIDIHEIQPSSTPPLTKVESFIVQSQSHQGNLSFSPACFHAALITETEVVILNVRNSQVLLRTKAPKPLYKAKGSFSLDGRLFACETLTQEICVWENTPTGYSPKERLRPQSGFKGFKISPTATWILCWDQESIQLLDPDATISPPPSGDRAIDHSANETRDGPGISHAEYRIGDGAQWVMDSRSGLPLLWLHPTWRTGKESDRRWDGNVLTVLGDSQERVVIQFP